MKRALAMALGAMMVAGSAAPASAASQIDFSGYYRVYYMSETNVGKRNDNYRAWDRTTDVRGDRGGDRGTMTDAYWAHRLNIDLVFRATDEISVYWRLRAPTFKRFGSSGHSRDNDSQGRTAMVTHHIYGQIDQDWGTVRVGQIDDGFDSYGLGSLGYAPSTDPSWTFVSPYDEGGRIDGVRYNNKWDNGFGLMAQYQKVDNNADNNSARRLAANSPSNRWSDEDFDRIAAEVTYEWDGGGAALGVRYDRDATMWGSNGDFDKMNAWYINPAIMHSWGDFSIHFEGMAGWGTTDVANPARAVAGDPRWRGQRDLDSEGYSFFLDGDYNYGPGNVTLAGWWASGTKLGKGYSNADVNGQSDWDPTRFGKNKSLVSIDQGNFYPLLVAFNATASGWGRDSTNAVALANNGFLFVDAGLNRGHFLNDVNDTLGAYGNFDVLFNDGEGVTTGSRNHNRNITRSFNNDSGSANHWAINLSGNHAFTDDISMHYAIAYLALNEPNYRVLERATFNGAGLGWSGLGYTDQDKDLGFEVDLGFSFQLLDNLKFVTSFGYMFNGDAYKSLRGYNVNAAGNQIRAVWDDPDDSYVWYNTLTFSF